MEDKINLAKGTAMKAFESTLVSYEQFLANVKRHKELDKYVSGVYWDVEANKGCAVGCTLHEFTSPKMYPQVVSALRETNLEIFAGNHALYEPLFGIPRIVARLQDHIFEGLPTGDAKEFPLQFAQALKAGVDYSGVWYKFAEWLLLDTEHGVIRHAKTERTRDAINSVGALYQRHNSGDVPTIEEWRAAAAAAADADADAYAYAADAAYAYAYAYAAAADADADAADAYAYAAADADAAAADAYVDAAARFQHYQAQRDKLLAILVECGEVVSA